MVSINRLAAMSRIRALRAKTVSNGCTESEALAAAAKAGELMDRYGLTFSDLEIKKARCRQHEATDRYHDVNLVAGAIARFCSCRLWFEGGRIQYFGLPIDVVIASYMTDLCRSAMNVGFDAFLHSNARPLGQSSRTLRKPFMVAMGCRLSERIEVLASAREAKATTADGTALVLVKKAVVEEQYRALGLKLTPGRASRYRDNDAARAAGRAAGDRVNLVTGIHGAPARKVLK
ncbi:DUF2786 domain-containing protein [uncultured Methylobacterium sp.]|uniref:DUF7168 domain-containing protein n=1 Tax=uncultured Methylobacterium sp. TaxID=157278 RepID=UPI002598F38A|nr:DUF2786 domain-containing protein [uncultured Methylobacterium sp.]